MPYIAVKLSGGIIIDLATSEIESQVNQLLEIGELTADLDLRTFLDSKVLTIKAGKPLDATVRSRKVDLLGS